MRKRLKNHFIPHAGNEYKPHFVRKNNVIAIAIVALAIFNLSFALNSYVIRHPGLLSAVITSVLVDLTNSNRLAANIGPLTPNPVLAAAAQLKANDMAEKSYFAHNSPDGKTPWHWFKEGGYEFLYAGENLAVNFSESEDVVLAWMNSEGHRANIMNNKFTEIGIAMAPGTYNGRDTIYVVQLFGQPVPKSIVQATEAVEESQEIVSVEQSETSGEVAAAETKEITKPEVEVLAENVEVLAESDMFIAVQNNDYLALAEENVGTGTESSTKASVVDQVLASPRTLLETIYVIMGAIVLIALVFILVIEPKRQDPKHFVYTILLFILVAVLFYFSKNYLFPKVVIE